MATLFAYLSYRDAPAAIEWLQALVFDVTTRTEWGTERARVLDPEGRKWSFGSYEPGQKW